MNVCVCVSKEKSGNESTGKTTSHNSKQTKGKNKKIHTQPQGTRHKAQGTRHTAHGTNHNANHKLQQLTELVPCPKLDPCTIASPLKIFFFPPLQFVNVTVYPAE